MEQEITSKLITREDCYQILTKYRSSQSCVVCVVDYKITKADDKVIGFLGDYFRLTIWFETGSNETTKLEQIGCFLKTEPMFNENQRNFVQDSGLFKKESFIYKHILPELEKIAGINFAPSCYLIKHDTLVLEDLKCRNFQIQKSDLTLDECEAMVKCLARFHSASVVFEELKSSKEEPFTIGSEYQDELIEGTLSFDDENSKCKWLKTTTNCIIDYWKSLPGYQDDELGEKLKEVTFGGKMETLIKPSEKFRNVLTHNDLWPNNIMSNPDLEYVLVDFQLVRYTPPAYDLVMALYMNTSSEFLQYNLNDMLDTYYTTFEQVLTDYALNPEDVFPKNEFLDSIQVYKLPALIEAAIFATNVYLPEERTSYILSDVEKYKDFTFGTRSPHIIDIFENNETYRKKLLGLIIPLAQCLRN